MVSNHLGPLSILLWVYSLAFRITLLLSGNAAANGTYFNTSDGYLYVHMQVQADMDIVKSIM